MSTVFKPRLPSSMAILSRSLALASIFPLTLAFVDTVPAIAWSTHPSPRLDSLASRPTPFAETSHLFGTLLEGDALCQYDAVVIAEQSGLHASDLRTLSTSSYVATRLRNAASSLQIPYLRQSDGDPFDEFKRTLTERCRSRRVELGLGQGGENIQPGEKHVICVSMPHLEGESRERKSAMREHEAQLSNDISRVTSSLPSHIVIYIGSHPFIKRQHNGTEPNNMPSRPVIQSGVEFDSPAFAPVNTTLATGGLFQRYRFFTPGLLTALLIVFGLLVPLLMVGICALANIQSPLRMDVPKGPSLVKKTQ